MNDGVKFLRQKINVNSVYFRKVIQTSFQNCKKHLPTFFTLQVLITSVIQ